MTRESDRIHAAVSRIHDSRARGHIARAMETLADAFELMPTGSGATDRRGGGFESAMPGDVSLYAAKVWREQTTALIGIGDAGRGLLARARRQGTGVTRYCLKTAGGRPSPLTHDLLRRARELRARGVPVRAALDTLSREYPVSRGALWGAMDRGTEPGDGNADRLLWLAMNGEESK